MMLEGIGTDEIDSRCVSFCFCKPDYCKLSYNLCVVFRFMKHIIFYPSET